jgi:pilus assembly protein CpaC
MNRDGFSKLLDGAVILVFMLAIVTTGLLAGEQDQSLTVYISQSEILDFQNPIKRVAIANPEVADATVITPNQILVNGKQSGITSMIVWSETEEYTKYRLCVHSQASDAQIQLNVKFMEVNTTALKEFGSDFLLKNLNVRGKQVNLGSFGGNVSAPSDPLLITSTVDFFFAMPTKNFSAIFKALFENNLLSILATPNLTVVSGSEASFLAGGEFPIPIVSGSMGLQTVTIQYKEYGVKLTFLPTILDSNIVNIKVATQVSSLDFENGIVLSGFEIPSLITRKTETTVELKEGEYLVIGGLINHEMAKTISRIPVLGHLPIIGLLFSSRKFQDRETELLIAISPKIVHSIPEEEVPVLRVDGMKKNKKEEPTVVEER